MIQNPPLISSNSPQQVLILTQLIIEMLKGRDNSTNSFTLEAGATTTTVNDNLFSSDMVPVWVPSTANAAGAMTNLYVSARSNGSFTLTHANTGTTDRTFFYSRRG